jgi:hypothetical protein
MEIQLSVDTQIDEIIRENKIYRFAYEFERTEDADRKAEIKKILNILQGTKEQEREDAAKSKLNKIYDNIDKFSLKRKWTKLSVAQKQDRIKEYLNLSIKDEKLREGVKEKLFTMLDDGKLKTTKLVDYDVENAQIKSINLETTKKDTKKTTKKLKAVNSDESE